MSDIESNKKIALEWIASFNAHDISGLLNLYADDAVHYSPKLKLREPETNGHIKGKQALQHWWAGAFERLPGLQYQLKNLIINDEQILMEYLRVVEGEDEMMVAEVLEINNNLIQTSRVYHG